MTTVLPAPQDTLPNVETQNKDINTGIVEPQVKKRRTRILGNYNRVLISRKLIVNIINVGSNIKQTLEKILSKDIEGKCINEGFIKPNFRNPSHRFDLVITFDGDVEIKRFWYRLKAERLSFPSEQKSASDDIIFSRYYRIEMTS